MNYRVDTVNGHRGMKDFLDLPYRVYHDDPDWVAPMRTEVSRVLDPSKNPYFRGADLRKFICYGKDKPLARAVSVINPALWNRNGSKTALFGFFESFPDESACRQLFDAMASYCRSRGAESFEGPYNPNHYSEIGLRTQGQGPPVFFEPYNPVYYTELLIETGFRAVKEMHTRYNPDVSGFLERSQPRNLAALEARGFSVRPFRLRDTKAELERIREVNNDAFADNYSFLPLSWAEYRFSAKYLFAVTRPALVLIAEHRGQPVGVMQCVLNINPLVHPMKGRFGPAGFLSFLLKRKQVREIVIYSIGIKKAYQGSPVIMLLLEKMRSIATKYPVVYTTWMTDDNKASVRASELLGLKPFRHFQLLGKSIIDES
jgi:hypothetical protein